MEASEPAFTRGLRVRLQRGATRYPNIGTVVNFSRIGGYSKVKLYDWRAAHPEFSLSLVYGVMLTVENSRIRFCGHGNFLKIQKGNLTRFYWYMPSNHADRRFIPNRVIADWDSGQPMRPQLLFDLKWFDPYPPMTKYTRQEFLSVVRQRLTTEVIANRCSRTHL